MHNTSTKKLPISEPRFSAPRPLPKPARTTTPSCSIFRGVHDTPMTKSFREALVSHMDAENTSISELARGADVSLDITKKLRTRLSASTNAETAVKIAAYYGKTVDAFFRGRRQR